MSQVQMASSSQELMELSNDLTSTMSIEVYQHVAAENRIEGSTHWPFFQQVQRLEGDEAAQAPSLIASIVLRSLLLV